MKITRCVPLAGQGVVARYGDLVAVAVDRAADPGPLVSALTEVAAAAGDGSDLVLSVVRAALGCSGRQPAWACAGVTADGGVSVLLHGRAAAVVRLDSGHEATLTTNRSLLPVTWTFTGTTATVALGTGERAAPDPHVWLGGGVVCGGGLTVTLSADVPAQTVMDRPTVMDGSAAMNGLTVAARPSGAMPGTGLAPDMPFYESSDNPVGPPVPPRPDWSVDVPAPDLGTGQGNDPEPALVDGVLCAREHFNDPRASHCWRCRISLDRLPRNFERRVRPPLGVLLLDDGTRLTLDQDYVLGREPRLDGDVIAGRARALPISDPKGTVSRQHLKVSLVGWRVEVSDLGSQNGSVVYSADGERRLAPLESAVIEPGARIGIGDRSIRYLSCEEEGVL